MKTPSYKKNKRSGLVTILSTVVICSFLLGLMGIMYRSSIRSLEAQRKVQLQIDYEARKQSFLRALVTLTPVYAANTMMNGSSNGTFAKFHGDGGLFDTAGNISKLGQARSTGDDTGMGFGEFLSGNTGNPSAYLISDYIGDGTASTPSGVGVASVNNYPVPMLSRASSAAVANSKLSPLISTDATYNGASSQGDDRDFNLIPYPNIHFGYKAPGDPFIARHNWWKVNIHASSNDITRAGVGTGANDRLENEYILSIYEVPSQLAISSSAFTNIGNIGGEAYDTGNSGNITFEGRTFAPKVEVTHVELDGVTSTKGATITDSIIGGDGTAQTLSRGAFEAANTGYHPIARASDFSRSMFLSINPGLDFFDRFANSSSDISNGLSKESWYQYSRGCHQCKMKLDVIEVAVGGNTPTALRFSYGAFTTVIHKASSNYAGGVDWPDSDDEVFPFISEVAANGLPGIEIHIGRFVDWLQTADGGSLSITNVAEYNSLVVCADYVGDADVAKPTTSVSPIVIMLRDCEDLTDYTKGFSLVTNYSLHILENFNQVSQTLNVEDYPPSSIFAPTIGFGLGDEFRSVSLSGSLGSLNNGTNAIEILALKDTAGNASAAQTFADLKPIETLEELPPVNVMNWLVVIRKTQ